MPGNWLGVGIALRGILRQEVDQLDERAANVDGDVTDHLCILVWQDDARRILAALLCKQCKANVSLAVTLAMLALRKARSNQSGTIWFPDKLRLILAAAVIGGKQQRTKVGLADGGICEVKLAPCALVVCTVAVPQDQCPCFWALAFW